MSRGEEVNQNLWNEIWGCVTYLKIPYETVMEMPVYVRRFWIEKHHAENEKEKGNGNTNDTKVGAMSINAYARMEQNNSKNNRN